jgi:hypothetical protein
MRPPLSCLCARDGRSPGTARFRGSAPASVCGAILHVQWWSWVLAPPVVVILLARLRGKRVVVGAHNVAPHGQARVKRWLNAAVLRLAHHIIVHAERSRAALIEQGSMQRRSASCRWGRILGHAAGGERQEQARSQLNIEPEAHVVLLFGNLRPYKGSTCCCGRESASS